MYLLYKLIILHRFGFSLINCILAFVVVNWNESLFSKLGEDNQQIETLYLWTYWVNLWKFLSMKSDKNTIFYINVFYLCNLKKHFYVRKMNILKEKSAVNPVVCKMCEWCVYITQNIPSYQENEFAWLSCIL